jgi:hypothetical protein
MVVQCHTVLGYGPRGAADADRPRPLVRVRYKTENAGRETIAAPRFLAGLVLEGLAAKLKDEAEYFPGEAFVLDDQPAASHIMAEHNGRIPIVRLEISRALFLDEQWFDPRRLRIDPSRLRRLQDYFVYALDRACRKFF